MLLLPWAELRVYAQLLLSEQMHEQKPQFIPQLMPWHLPGLRYASCLLEPLP